MNPEDQSRPNLPPKLAELSERMARPPASVHKGLLIAAFLPGMGEVYQGNSRKGMRIFFESLALVILLVFTTPLCSLFSGMDQSKVTDDLLTVPACTHS